ncbi:sugar kinase [Streptococcus didelphis]|uniref:Sugar kinase n=1 Tax=Streptococcus didelphis TaxID=102886 RepID=A0ABY9LIV3_9STRE|nr:sugar kinase [Streptococcus didelphis]
MIRISPQNPHHFHNNCQSKLFYGGSEVNIARALQAFGQRTKLATSIPCGLIGDSFIQFLKENHIDTSPIQRVGQRIGLYFFENSFGCRQGQVLYDRDNSSLHDFDPSNIDFDSLFKDVSYFHFSGITLALGKDIRHTINIFLEEAKKRGVSISFDLNFRSRLLQPEEAKYLFTEFAEFADICFGIEPLMLDETDLSFFDRDNAAPDTIKNRMLALTKRFNFQTIFHTHRKQDSFGRNHYQAFLATDQGEFFLSKALKTQLLQRIGSGDAFVAGALHCLIEETNKQEMLNFAVASATLKCTLEGDNMFEAPSQVRQVLKEGKDIIR